MTGSLSCQPMHWWRVFVAQTLLASAQGEGYSLRRERCAEQHAWDSEPECGPEMRWIATCSGPYAAALIARVAVFSHDFKRVERWPKLATDSCAARLL